MSGIRHTTDAGEVLFLMSPRKHLEVVTAVLCGAAALAYATSEVFLPLEGSLFIVALAGGWLVPCRRRERIPASFWTVGLLAFLLVQTFRIRPALGEDVVLRLYEFLRWLLIAKVWTRRPVRDYWQILALSFFALLGGIVFNYSVNAIVPVALFLTAAPIALLLLAGAGRGSEPTYSTAWNPKRAYAMALLAALIILVGGTLTFIILPRLSGSFIPLGAGPGEAARSFPNELDLFGRGLLNPSERVVFRVRPTPALEQPPLWRVIAMEEFDGRRWWSAGGIASTLGVTGGGLFGWDPNNRANWSQRFEFQLSPLSLPALLVPHVYSPVRPEGILVQGPFRHVEVTSNGELRFERPGEEEVLPLEYGLYFSETPAPGARALSDREYTRLTRVPERISPRVAELAEQLSSGISEPVLVADAIRRYLEGNFIYSLERRAGRSSQPLESFLFEERAGHCEYFASAAAVLLRASGVPARVVNGFAAGDYAEDENEWVVRESDAHSWTEYFVPGIGWQTLDASPRDFAAERDMLGRWRLAFADVRQQAELWWYDRVLRYSLADQLGMVTKLADGRLGGGNREKSPIPDAGVPVPWEWIAAAVVMLAGIIAGLGFRTRHARRKAASDRNFERLLQRLRREARRRGVPTHPGVTPMALSEAVGQQVPAGTARALRRWVIDYNRVRFSPDEPARVECRQLDRSLGELCRALRHLPTPARSGKLTTDTAER